MLVSNRHRSARCWTRASALARDSLCSVSLFLILSSVSSSHSASAEARVQHSARERKRLSHKQDRRACVPLSVCESNANTRRLAECKRAKKTECDWLRLAWISGRSKKNSMRGHPSTTHRPHPKIRESFTLRINSSKPVHLCIPESKKPSSRFKLIRRINQFELF